MAPSARQGAIGRAEAEANTPVNLGRDVVPDPSQTLVISHTQFGSAGGYVDGGNNIIDPDPALGPLADNGGPTETMAISTASPAYNAGSSAEQFDQRGVPRPQNGSDDIGAFELDDTAPGVSITPLGTTADTTPQMSFSSPDPDVTGFACALDGPTQVPLGSTYQTCSSPITLGPLADGDYALKVRASDIAMNVGTASEAFSIDTSGGSEGNDPPPDNTPPPDDTTPPDDTSPPDTAIDGSAKAKKKQKQKRKKIVVKVKVKAKEDLRAKATGKVKVKKKSYKLKSQTKSVSEGTKRTLKLKPKKRKQAKKIAKALKKGKKAKAKLAVKLTDGAGNKKVEKLKVKLKR